jgi:hypothetical protein
MRCKEVRVYPLTLRETAELFAKVCPVELTRAEYAIEITRGVTMCICFKLTADHEHQPSFSHDPLEDFSKTRFIASLQVK